jgi:hypothetical protein
MVVYINSFLDPIVMPEFVNTDYESIWVKMRYPDHMADNIGILEKPKVIGKPLKNDFRYFLKQSLILNYKTENYLIH